MDKSYIHSFTFNIPTENETLNEISRINNCTDNYICILETKNKKQVIIDKRKTK